MYFTILRELFQTLEIDLVIDVGASYGRFAQSLRNFYDGNILSFEPVSSVFKELEKRSLQDPRWEVYNFALGHEDAVKEIKFSDHTVFSSFLDVNKFCVQELGQSSLATKKEAVRIGRLEDFLDSNVSDLAERKIFLKLDTQGYDIEAIQGLGNKTHYINILQSEVSVVPVYEGMTHWLESLSYFEGLGFQITGLFPVSICWPKVIEYDCLMVKNILKC